MKKYLKVAVFLFFAFFFSDGLAQSKGSIQKQYTSGKELFKQGKYVPAMEVFKDLAKVSTQNPFVEYASFYYGLSALKANDTKAARDMFLQIIQKFPGWEKTDEVNYWLGKIYLDEGNLQQGFTYLNKIKKKDTQAGAQALKLHFINQLEDIDQLNQAYTFNRKNKEVGQLVAKKISVMPLADQNKELLDQVIKDHGLKKEKYVRDIGKSQKKLSYKVAVMLPFFYMDMVGNGKSVGNQFVVDLYQGMLLGLQKVNEDGANIELFAYDTRRDSTHTKKLLQQEEIKGMDMIIGPLYPGPSQVVSAFSNQYRINMVNPISNNAQVIGNNPYSFLFKPSYETQVRKVVEFASQEFTNKKSMVIYGTSQKDSVSAQAYLKAAEKAGIEVLQMLQVSAYDAKRVLDMLTGSKDGKMNLPFEGVGHVYVSSSDEVIIANIISALENRRDKIALIGSEEWLNFKFITYDQLERLKVYLVAPNLVNFNNENVEKFRNTYMDETKSLPSPFTYNGYEMMLFVGQALKNYGTYFQNYSKEMGVQKGELFPAHSFIEANDNQYVPIFKLENSDLVIANPVR